MRRLITQQVDTADTREAKYQNLRKENCQLCPLWKTAQHVCLIGQGNLDADIMLVGEAPGYREDGTGRPFSGKSGYFLDDIFEELEVSRDDLYITNAVHCRPPENRTPKPREIKECYPYLEREINLVKPKIIIPMGNVAMKAVIGRTGITKFRGKTFEYSGPGFKAVVLPTFHPAAILRNPGNLDFFVEDMSNAFNMSGGDYTHEYDKVDPVIITSIEDVKVLIRKIKKKGYCVFDCETNTLNWWEDDAVIATIHFAVGAKRAYCIPIEHEESPFTAEDIVRIFKLLNKGVFSNKKVVKINQNIKFDIHFVMNYGCKVLGELHDTIFLHFLINENVPHDLDSLSLQYTNFGEYWKGVGAAGLKQGLAPKIPLKILAPYGCTDASATLMVYRILIKLVKAESKLYNVYRYIQVPSMKCLLDAERRGMMIDLNFLDSLVGKFSEEIKWIKGVLFKYKEVKRVTTNMKEGKWFCLAPDKPTPKDKPDDFEFNLNSTQQLAELLFSKDGFGFKSKEKTDGGAPSSKEDVLIDLTQRYPKKAKFVATLLEYRKIIKLDGQYVRGVYKHIASDGCVHPKFKETGTKTGRPSCKQPNVQQVPRPEPAQYDSPMKAEIKKMFIPRPGYVYLHVDESQCELRVMTHYSGERNMLKWFNAGKDVHTYVAAKMMGMSIKEFEKLPDKKPRRKRAKAVNFGTIYCVGKYTLAINLSSPLEGIHYSPDEAGEFLEEYFQMFPAIRVMMKRLQKQATTEGYVETLFGLRRRLPDIHSDNNYFAQEALRQAVNAPIQGTAGQLTMFAMAYLMGHVDGKRKIPKDVYLVNEIHDALLLEVREKDLIEVSKSVVKYMENPPTKKYFGFKLKVPLIADAEVGRKNWAKFEKIEVIENCKSESYEDGYIMKGAHS